MRYTQVPADFDLQLFASDPDVVKPIYVAWDERGRAWVVEARDYPHGLVNEGEPGKADIKICEDTDGDGRADKFTIFGNKLNLATSLAALTTGSAARWAIQTSVATSAARTSRSARGCFV